MKTTLQFCVGSALSALCGLFVALLVGVLWWPPGAGLTLIGIGLVTAGCLARFLSHQFDWPASVVASGIGAMVACFLASATAEALTPGSFEWMVKGGLYGACFGLPVALVLGPIGIIENRNRGAKRRSDD